MDKEIDFKKIGQQMGAAMRKIELEGGNKAIDELYPDGIDALNATATGLTVSTTYFFWLRATNTAGDGLYFGPLQTVTEPSDTAGDVSFAIAEISFDTVQAQWTQPTGKAYNSH